MLGVMRDLVDSSGFLVALLTASGASLLSVVIARGRVRSVALGVAAVAAAFVGLGADDVFRGALVPAVALLVVAALVLEGRPLVVQMAAVVPGGAVLVTYGAPGTSGWARLVVLLTVVVVCPVSTISDRRLPLLTFGLFAISALGVYATVPDTEQARVLVGALLPFAVVALAASRVSEPAGPTAVAALLAWAALVGGVGRPGSVVGALGCFGVLALGPLTTRGGAVRLVVVHVGVVLLASRVAGLRQSAWTALVILVPVIVLAAIVLATGERGPARNPP
jgi:hypothetical protein